LTTGLAVGLTTVLAVGLIGGLIDDPVDGLSVTTVIAGLPFPRSCSRPNDRFRRMIVR